MSILSVHDVLIQSQEPQNKRHAMAESAFTIHDEPLALHVGI